MGEKGSNQGGERVAISYKMPPYIYEKVNKLVYEEKSFRLYQIALPKH
jgi:hypothetical protein